MTGFDAWISGELTSQHVNKLARAQARAVDYWILQADPEGAEEVAEQGRGARRFDLSRSFEDTWFDVGVHRRLFEGATRRAVEVRDQECFHPSCEVPAEDCQADHIEPHAWGGETTQDNGRAACGFHNRARHRRT